MRHGIEQDLVELTPDFDRVHVTIKVLRTAPSHLCHEVSLTQEFFEQCWNSRIGRIVCHRMIVGGGGIQRHVVSLRH